MPRDPLSAGLPGDRAFLRVLCHEFRTPIASLQALARALDDQATRLTAEQRHEALLLIAGHADHLSAMLDAVRTVAEHLPGGTSPRPARVRLTAVAAAAAAAAGLDRVDVDVAADLDTVVIDVSAVRRILTNLLENAQRHGAGPVALSGHRCAEGIVLVVTDRGPGMPDDIAGTAFQATTQPPPGPRGLGLWIVTQLVTMLGGAVQARPNHPRGTHVEVRLPLPAHADHGVVAPPA